MTNPSDVSPRSAGRRQFLTRGAFAAGALALPLGASAASSSDLAPEAAGPPAAGARVFDITDYGAVGDGTTMNTEAFARALTACKDAMGGTVYVPPGVFLSGPLQLPSFTTLHVEAGATVLGSSRVADYPAEQAERGSSGDESRRTGLVTAVDAEAVTVTGRGIIDGSGMAFSDLSRVYIGADYDRGRARQGALFMDPRYGADGGPAVPQNDRPGNLVRFVRCRNVLVEGVTLQNSPVWTLYFDTCQNAKVRGLSITSQDSDRRVPNDDGMDFYRCADVQVSDCTVETGDDCIALFGGERITVTNCTLTSRSAGVRVSNRGTSGVRDCAFSNLVIYGNRGLNIASLTEGDIENVSFENIVIRSALVTGQWWGKGEAIHIGALPRKTGAAFGAIRNLRFSNITADSDAGILLYGDASKPVEDIEFSNVRLRLTNGPLQLSYGGNIDLRPTPTAETSIFAADLSAFYARHARGLRVDGLAVRYDDGLPDFVRHAVHLEDFQDVVIEGLDARQAHAGSDDAVIHLARGREISVRRSRAARGSGVFLRHTEVTDPRVFAENDLAAAQTAFHPTPLAFTMSGNRMPG